MESTLSELQNQEESIPQGSIQSVTLFIICYKSTQIYIVEQQIQLSLDEINKWAIDNGLKFSKSKTQSVHFCSLRKMHNNLVINVCSHFLIVRKALSKESSIFTIEACAIDLAFNIIPESNYKTLIIFSDLLSVLLSLINKKLEDP